MGESVKDIETMYLQLVTSTSNISVIIDKLNKLKQGGLKRKDLKKIKLMRTEVISENDGNRKAINVISDNFRLMYEIASKRKINFIENEIGEYRRCVNLTDIYIQCLDDDIKSLERNTASV